MGFKKSTEVRKQFLELCDQPNRVLYDISSGAQLPATLKFEVAVTDLSSRLYSVYYGIRTGLDLLRLLNGTVQDLATKFEVCNFFFCVDDRKHVSRGKGAERALRLQSKDVVPYGDTVSLRSDPPSSVSTDSYVFSLEAALPDDYDRLLATAPLRRKWFVFLGELLSCFLKRPVVEGQSMTSVTISGFPRCSCGAKECELSQDTSVVKTVFLGGSPLNEVDAELQHEIMQDVARQINDGAVQHTRVPANYEACKIVPGAQTACKRHVDRHPQRVSPSICIGESEGQCFYWVDQMVRNENIKRVLVRVNDADGWVCGLTCVPRLYNPKAGEIEKALWIDLTSSSTSVKFIDIVEMWRQVTSKIYTLGGVVRSGLSSSTTSLSSSANDVGTAQTIEGGRRRRRHGLRHPAELAIFVATLTANDYCNSLSRLGPAALFKALRATFATRVAQSDPPFIYINKENGDMLIDEKLAYDFIISCYGEMTPVKDALRALKIPAANLGDASSLQRLGEHFAQELETKIAELRAENKKETGVINAALSMPSADFIRATVRRACFSLYYYSNLYKPMKIDALAKIDGLPLYGYLDDDTFSDVVFVRHDLRPFVVVGGSTSIRSSLQRSASAAAVVVVPSSSTNSSACSSVTSVADDDEAVPEDEGATKRKSGITDSDRTRVESVDDDGDEGEWSRVKRHASQPVNRGGSRETPLSQASTAPTSPDRTLRTTTEPGSHPVMAFLRQIAASGLVTTTTETGPEYAWIDTTRGHGTPPRVPFRGGEWGSNFFLMQQFEAMSLRSSSSR